MAISAPMKTFISSLQGNIVFCHQATYSIYQFGVHNKQPSSPTIKNSLFAIKLQEYRNQHPHLLQINYDPKTAVPPHLYEVFGLFFPNGQLIHSGIVVDEDPVTIAEWSQYKGIHLTPLEEFINNSWTSMKHEKVLFNAQILEALDHGVEFMAAEFDFSNAPGSISESILRNFQSGQNK